MKKKQILPMAVIALVVAIGFEKFKTTGSAGGPGKKFL